jgi:hypothetical protein
VEHARVKLNEALAAFALKPLAEFDLVTAYSSDYGRRGVCATTDWQSRPRLGKACFTTQDLFKLRCAPEADIAESMHLPRAGRLSPACSGDPAAFLPFPPQRFEPYRSRTRLFRTLNDAFLAINQSPQSDRDQSPFGVLDLSGRATGGAFHPTAEGHSIIANDTTEELCQRLGCGQ